MIRTGSDKRPLQVFVVGPCAPESSRSFSGEHAYVRSLLDHPPAGVETTHYTDLLQSGGARVLAWPNWIVPRIARWASIPLWGVFLAFGEAPDLIHVHGFSPRLVVPRRVPVILSGSTGQEVEQRYYWGHSDQEIRQILQRQRLLARFFGIYDRTVWPRDAAVVTVWSEFAARGLKRTGYVPAGRIQVVPPGVESPSWAGRRETASQGITFLFVGIDFERKNGPLLLSAFQRVRERCRDARLVMVTNLPDTQSIVGPNVALYPPMSKARLFDEVFPQADVLILPSKVDGFGLVLLEAMSFGLPVIGVDAWAMPEIVQDGVTGYLIQPDSLDELVSRMLSFAEQPRLVTEMQGAVKIRFAEQFSIEAHNDRLGRLYAQVVN